MPDITSPRPVDGEPVATLWGQQVHDAIESILGARSISFPTASFSIPYNVWTAIPQSQLTGVSPGVHVLLAMMSIDCTTAGFGEVQISPYVDGVAAGGASATYMAAAAGHRAAIAGVWLVTVTGAGAIELRAQKTTNGGQAQVVASRCNLIVI